MPATPLASSQTGATRTGTAEAATTTTPLATSAMTSPLATGMPGETPTSATVASGTSVPGAGLNNVTYTATDKGYNGPASFPSGWTQLTLNNQGTKSHDLQLMGLQAGKTITDVISALQSQGPPPAWVTFYGSMSAQPGQSTYYVVNPPPGNYVIFSFGQNAPNQLPDALQGLLNSITVTAPQAGAAQPVLPKPAATVGLLDYSFVVTGTFAAGTQLVELSNNGKEIHEASWLPLKSGKTIADFNKAMQSEMSGTPVPPEQLPVGNGPTISLSPGVTIYVPVTLSAGEYVLACFVPSPSHGGEPHAALGMVKQVTVK